MSNRTIIIGLILVLVGVLMLSSTLDIFRFSFDNVIGFVVPVLLIGVGIRLLARRRGENMADQAEAESMNSAPSDGSSSSTTRAWSSDKSESFDQPGSSSSSSHRDETRGGASRSSESPQSRSPGRLRYNKFIGDMYIDCSGINLQNIEVSNFLGDVEIKLHGGILSPGLNRMIVSGFIGDVRILVPEGMAVFAQSSNFIGDIEMMGHRSSGFGNSLDAQTADYGQANAKLYIASNHFIGDVRVYIV